MVFNATRLNNANGGYAGSDPVADRILANGDTLFGSRVTFAGVDRGGINELGEIAINYRLEDGRSGIAIATPVPEPGACAAVALAAGVLIARRRGHKRG